MTARGPVSPQEPASSQAAPAAEAKRSRRLYICWGMALTLLVSLSLFCWLVVVPVVTLRQEVRKALGPPPISFDFEEWSNSHKPESRIGVLGGAEDASLKLGSFLRLPRWAVGKDEDEVDAMDRIDPYYRHRAVRLLTHCGSDGVEELAALLTTTDREVRLAALTGLALLGGEHERARHAIERALDHEDEKVRALAADILKSVRVEAGGLKWPKR
jgi:HEAT repeat protein